MKRRRKTTPKEIHDLPSFGFRTVTVDLPKMDDPDAVARAMRVESVVEHHSGGEEVTARRWPYTDRWGRNPSLPEPIEVTIVADVGTFRLHDKITVSIAHAGGRPNTPEMPNEPDYPIEPLKEYRL